jgi:hypothetical protein
MIKYALPEHKYDIHGLDAVIETSDLLLEVINIHQVVDYHCFDLELLDSFSCGESYPKTKKQNKTKIK